MNRSSNLAAPAPDTWRCVICRQQRSFNPRLLFVYLWPARVFLVWFQSVRWSGFGDAMPGSGTKRRREAEDAGDDKGGDGSGGSGWGDVLLMSQRPTTPVSRR